MSEFLTKLAEGAVFFTALLSLVLSVIANVRLDRRDRREKR